MFNSLSNTFWSARAWCSIHLPSLSSWFYCVKSYLFFASLCTVSRQLGEVLQWICVSPSFVVNFGRRLFRSSSQQFPSNYQSKSSMTSSAPALHMEDYHEQHIQRILGNFGDQLQHVAASWQWEDWFTWLVRQSMTPQFEGLTLDEIDFVYQSALSQTRSNRPPESDSSTNPSLNSSSSSSQIFHMHITNMLLVGGETVSFPCSCGNLREGINRIDRAFPGNRIVMFRFEQDHEEQEFQLERKSFSKYKVDIHRQDGPLGSAAVRALLRQSNSSGDVKRLLYFRQLLLQGFWIAGRRLRFLTFTSDSVHKSTVILFAEEGPLLQTVRVEAVLRWIGLAQGDMLPSKRALRVAQLLSPSIPGRQSPRNSSSCESTSIPSGPKVVD